MRTLEFKLYLKAEQQKLVDSWLTDLRGVWNAALDLLLEHAAFRAWDRLEKSWVPCCPLPWKFRYRPNPEGEGYIAVAYSQAARVRPWAQFCPLPQDYRVPRLESPGEFTLAAEFAHKRRPWLAHIPANLIRGVIASLVAAWERHKKDPKNCGEPKFKRPGRGDLDTLIHGDPKGAKIQPGVLPKRHPEIADARLRKRKIAFPGLGVLHARGLEHWPAEVPVCMVKITRRPSGYYLQLTGELPDSWQPKDARPKERATAIAFDPPKQHHADDTGRVVSAPAFLQPKLDRLAKLQRKADRQQPGSNRQKRTYHRIGKLHEQIRLARRNYNQKLSTFAVRKAGALAVAQIQPALKVKTRRPKPVPSKKGLGTFDPNGAQQKSAFNLRLIDIALGQFVALLEAKAKSRGREFQRAVNAPAASIREKGLVSWSRVYPGWAGSTDAEGGESSPAKRQGEQSPPGGVPATVTSTSSTKQNSSSSGPSGTTGANKGQKPDSKRTLQSRKAKQVLENAESQVQNASSAVDPPQEQYQIDPQSPRARRSTKKSAEDGSGSDFRAPP